MSDDNKLLIEISGKATSFVDELERVKKQTKDLQKVLEDIAKGSAIAFAASAAAIALTTKAFADYQTALVGVGKTTDIRGKELSDFGRKFQELSQKIPVATNELLGIAQAAGQLGVRGEANLLKFTDTVAKLGVATDLSGSEAAIALTRILTVTGEGVGVIDKFGSAIVALGNNFAASESEIVRVATEVSRSTAVFNVSAANVAAISTAMRAMGIQAELGGSAVGRAFRAIDASIRNGGAQLQNLEKITGLTGAELKKTFAENSVVVFQKFIQGLARIKDQGGDTTAALASFKLRGEEILKVLPPLAKNSDVLAKALDLVGKEMKNATALEKEAAAAFATVNSQFQLLQNSATNAASAIGEQLAPDVVELLNGTTDLIKSLFKADSVLVSLIATFLKWAAALTASVTAVSTAGIAYLTFNRIMAALKIAFDVSRLAVIGFTSALTFGLTALIAFLPEIVSFIGTIAKGFAGKAETETIDEITEKLDELLARREDLAKKQEAGFDNTKQLAAIDAEIEKVQELRRARLDASNSDFGTGKLLIRPETDTAGFDPSFGGLFKQQSIPFAPAADTPGLKREEDHQKNITDLASKGADTRLRNAQAEYAKLAEIDRLYKDGATKEEIEFGERRAQIAVERQAALAETDGRTRAVLLENNRLQYEALLNQEAEYYAKKVELKNNQLETDAEFDAIVRETQLASVDAMNAEDLNTLQAKLETEKQARARFQTEQINQQIVLHNKFKQDEIQYGTEVAKVKQFFASQELANAKTAAGELVALTASKNATLNAIGRAASSVQAAIATGEGAIKAYSSLAGIPIVGPALGAAAAAAVIAFGLEQQRNILAANDGGVVPALFGSATGKDSVSASLTPGEIVVPDKNFDEVVNAVADERVSTGQTGSGEQGGGRGITNNFYGDYFGDEVFVDKMAERFYDAQKTRGVQLVP